MTEYTAYELLQELKPYAPKWCKYLSEKNTNLNTNLYEHTYYDIIDKQHLNMADPTNCILGEIHGFSEEYSWKIKGCKECQRLDQLIVNVFKEETDFTMKEFLIMVVDHLKSKTCSGIVC